MNKSTEIIKSEETTVLDLVGFKSLESWAKELKTPQGNTVSVRTLYNYVADNYPNLENSCKIKEANLEGVCKIKTYRGRQTKVYSISAFDGLQNWLARNQFNQGNQSAASKEAVEYVTKEAVQAIVSAAVETVTKSLLETISILQEDNKKLHEQLSQLLSVPKTLSLPSGQTVHPLKAALPLESFCKYMEIPMPVLLSKKSPLSGGKSINDFPLTTLEQFLSYVSYILEEGYSSSQRYSWLQSHSKAARKLGYNL